MSDTGVGSLCYFCPFISQWVLGYPFSIGLSRWLGCDVCPSLLVVLDLEKDNGEVL